MKILCTDPNGSSVYFPGVCHGRCSSNLGSSLCTPPLKIEICTTSHEGKGSREGWDGTKAEAELPISRVEPQTQSLGGSFGEGTTKPTKIPPKTKQQQQEQQEREIP